MRRQLPRLAIALGALLLGAPCAVAQEQTQTSRASGAVEEPLGAPPPQKSSPPIPEAPEAEPPAEVQPSAGTVPSASIPSATTPAPQAVPYGYPDPAPLEPEPMAQWLDEVKAQRRAWEERRRAAKEARDARRRWIDPWGAAQHQAMEQEVQRRRDAFREKIERDREAFRNRGPWSSPLAPWDEGPAPPHDLIEGPDGGSEPPPPEAAYPPLPGWDNLWYYRGF